MPSGFMKMRAPSHQTSPLFATLAGFLLGFKKVAVALFPTSCAAFLKVRRAAFAPLPEWCRATSADHKRPVAGCSSKAH